MDPTSRIAPKLAVATLATFAAILGFVGCGEAPTFDPATQYSADTLAREFVFEYGQLRTKDGGAVRSQVIKPSPEATKEAAKGSAATKKAQPGSLDELIAETLRKAKQIPGTFPADACKKVVDEVAKDASIPDGDKKIIAQGLGQGPG